MDEREESEADESDRKRVEELIDEAFAQRPALAASVADKRLKALELADGEPAAASRILEKDLLSRDESRDLRAIYRHAIAQASVERQKAESGDDWDDPPLWPRVREAVWSFRVDTWSMIRRARWFRWPSLLLCRRWDRHGWDSWIEVDLVGDPHNVGKICLYCGETRRRPE